VITGPITSFTQMKHFSCGGIFSISDLIYCKVTVVVKDVCNSIHIVILDKLVNIWNLVAYFLDHPMTATT